MVDQPGIQAPVEARLGEGVEAWQDGHAGTHFRHQADCIEAGAFILGTDLGAGRGGEFTDDCVEAVALAEGQQGAALQVFQADGTFAARERVFGRRADVKPF